MVKIFALEDLKLKGNCLIEKEMLEILSNCNKLKLICPKLISFGKLFKKENDDLNDWKNWEYPYICETFIKGKSLFTIHKKMNNYDMMNLGKFQINIFHFD